MKKIFAILLMLSISVYSSAQTPVIGTIISTAIKAVDLRIQQLQNETLWLQNAQKTIENILHKIKMEEITGWSQKQKDLYQNYFKELSLVRSGISQLSLQQNLVSRQAAVASACRSGLEKAKSSNLFSSPELSVLENDLTAILQKSLNALSQWQVITTSQTTVSSDAGRIEIMKGASDIVSQCLFATDKLNENIEATIGMRKQSKANNKSLKKLYGLP